jgi:hypothetical protein
MALEVALAEVEDDHPGRVTLLGRTRDPVVVAWVSAHLGCAVSPLDWSRRIPPFGRSGGGGKPDA